MKSCSRPVRALSHLLILGLILNPTLVLAQQNLAITPDGSTNTQITKTASGIDQVNIAAPNAAGMSHNKFTDYNVNRSGQIINNFSGVNGSVTAGSGASAFTSTHIGGLVAANTNLTHAGRQASVIMNEVTSTNNSQILGYTEIAGGRAQLLIVNPNGIACRGCGFINTSRLSMIAGRSEVDGEGNMSFDLNRKENSSSAPINIPLITIEGLGLDVESTDYTDIIASSVKLIAGVYGGEETQVNIKTGDGKYNYQTEEVTSDLSSTSEELFAIDASTLGAVTAGRIFIVATKEGLGVNMGSEFSASKEVNIDVNGNIYYTDIHSGDVLEVKSSQKVESLNSDSKLSAPNITVQAGEFKNLGSVSSYNLNIIDSAKLSNFGEIKALDLTITNVLAIENSGTIYGEDFLNISGGSLSNASLGSIVSLQSYSVILTGLLSNNGLISSQNTLNVIAGSLENEVGSEISSNGDLTLTISGSAINYGNLISEKALSFSADSLTNHKVIQSADEAIFNLHTLSNLENSSIYSDENLNLVVSGSLDNSGEISTLGKLSISGLAQIDNAGKLLSNGALEISGSSLVNDAGFTIASLASYVTMSLSGKLQNDGTIISKDYFSANGQDIINSGLIDVTNIALLTSYQDFTNSGAINSGDNLTVTVSRNMTNSGDIKSAKVLTLTVDETLSNSAIIESKQNSVIKTSHLINFGTIEVLSSLSIYADTISNQADAVIFSEGDLTINSNIASDAFSNNGEVSTLSNLVINSYSLSNSGVIYGLMNVDISNDNKLENSGTIYSDDNLVINTDSLSNLSSGWIFSNKVFDASLVEGSLSVDEAFLSNLKVTISANGDVSNAGSIISKSGFYLSAANVTNSGEIKAALDSKIDVDVDFTNELGGLIYGDNDVTIGAGNAVSNSGNIWAVDAAVISTSSFINDGGVIANNSVTINSNSFANKLGGTVASSDKSLILNLSDSFKNGGTVFAKEEITLANISDNSELNSFDNTGDISFRSLINGLSVKDFDNSGSFVSAQSLALTISNSFDNSGDITSQDDLTITAKNANNNLEFKNSGIVASTNNLTLSSDSISNDGEISSANKSLTFNLSGGFKNTGIIFAQESFTLKDADSETALSSFNNSGDISFETLFGGLLVKEFINSGNIASANDLSLTIKNSFDNSGNIYSQDGFTVTAKNSSSDLEFVNSGIVTATSDLTINSNIISNSGEISSQNNLTINNSAKVTNSGKILSNNKLKIEAVNLVNDENSVIASIYSSLTLTISDLLKNDGELSSLTNLTARGKNVSNSGNILKSDDIKLTATELLSNSGNIIGSKDLLISSDRLTNSGEISSQDSVTINSSLLSNSGVVYALSNLEIVNVGNLENSGAIYSADNLSINAGSLNNLSTGWIFSNKVVDESLVDGSLSADELFEVNSKVRVDVVGDISNDGSILSKSGFYIAAANLVNSGEIKSALNSQIKLDFDFTNKVGGLIYAEMDVVIEASNTVTNYGAISAIDTATINASLATNEGNIITNNIFTINAGSFENKLGGTLASVNKSLIFNLSDSFKNAGVVFAKEDLTLANLNGSHLNSFDNSGDVSFRSLLNALLVGSFANSGNVTSRQDLTLTIDDSFDNSGQLISLENLTITAKNSNNDLELINSGLVTATNEIVINSDIISNDGEISAQDKLDINNSGKVTNAGKIVSNNALEIDADNLTNDEDSVITSILSSLSLTITNLFKNDGEMSSATAFTASGKSFSNSGNILQSSDIRLTATESLDNSGNIIGSKNVLITSDSLTNSGEISSQDAITINNSGKVTNSGKILANGAIQIEANNFTNDEESVIASILSSLSLTITSLFKNDGEMSSVTAFTASGKNISNSGDILQSNDIKLTATESLDNSGNIIGSKDVLITSDSLTNSGEISSQDALTINNSGKVTNSGKILANGAIQIEAISFTNDEESVVASILSSLSLTITNLFKNDGEVSALTDLTASGKNISNSGNILKSDDIKLTASEAFGNSGNIIGSKDLVISSNGLTNSGEISSQDTVTVNSSLLSNSGVMYALRNLEIVNGGSLENSGVIYSDDNLRIDAGSLSNLSTGWIFSNRVFDESLVDGSLSADELFEANSKVRVNVAGDVSNDGSILSKSGFYIAAANLVNSGDIKGARDSKIDLDIDFTNEVGGLIYAESDVVIEASNSATNYGAISAIDTATINANLVTNEGDIITNNVFTMNASSFENKFGGTLASVDKSLILNLSDSFKNDGVVFAKDDLTLANLNGVKLNSFENSGDVSFGSLLNALLVGSFTNSGNVTSTQDLTLTIDDSFDNSGQLISLESLTITATNSNNDLELINSGLVTATNEIVINSDIISNYGEISAQNKLYIDNFGKVTNAGNILSNNALEIDAADLTNDEDSVITSIFSSLTLTIIDLLKNDGELSSFANLTASGKNVSNFGNIAKSSDIKLTATESLDNSGNIIGSKDVLITSDSVINSGEISSADTLTINNSGKVTNAGKMLSNNALKIDADNLTNDENSVIASILSSLTLIIADLFKNDGEISSQDAVTINSSLLSNSGVIYALSNLEIVNVGDLENYGAIYSDDNVSINAGSLSNLSTGWIFSNNVGESLVDGSLSADELFDANSKVRVDVAGDVSNEGLILSKSGFYIAAANLVNSGDIKGALDSKIDLDIDFTNEIGGLIYAENDVVMEASNSVTNYGNISAIDTATINASLVTNESNLIANNIFTINAGSFENKLGATVASSDKSLILNLSNDFKNAGVVFAKEDLTLASQNGSQLNSFDNSGDVSFRSLLNALLVGSFTNSGNLNSGQNLSLTIDDSFNNSGQINSQDGLLITARNSVNNLEFVNSGIITATGDMSINADIISNEGEISSQQSLTISGLGKVSNFSKILSNNALTINASELSNGEESIIASIETSLTLTITNLLRNDGELSAASSLEMSGKNISNYGDVLRSTAITVTATNLLENFGNIVGANSSVLTSDILTNEGEISSQGKLTFDNSGSVTNSGIILSNDILKIEAGSLTNNENSSIASLSSSLILIIAESLQNDGEISSVGNLSASSSSLSNLGNILSSGDLTITTIGLLENSGNVQSAKDSYLTLGSLNNLGLVQSFQDLTINAGSILNEENATLFSTAKSSITVTELLTNKGRVLSSGTSDFAIKKTINEGEIFSSGILDFTLSDSLTNTGTITSELGINIFSTSTVTNSNQIISDGALSIEATSLTNNSDSTVASLLSSLTLILSDFTNFSTSTAHTTLNLTSDSVTNSGEISSENSLVITNSGKIDNSGEILAGGTVNIGSNNLTNNQNSYIASINASLALTITQTLQNDGELSSKTNFVATGENISNAGNMLSSVDLTLTAGDLLSNSGNIQTIENLFLNSTTLTNSGSIKSFQTATINTAAITNNLNSTIYSQSDLEIIASGLLTNKGSILSVGKGDFTFNEAINQGRLSSSGNLTITLQGSPSIDGYNLTNSGDINSLSNLEVISDSAGNDTSINNSNEISSKGNLTINVSSLINSGDIETGIIKDKDDEDVSYYGKITLNLTSLTNSNNISSAGALNITTAANGSVTNSSALRSTDKFTINTGTFTNSANSLILSGKDLEISASAITNKDTKPSDFSVTSGIVSTGGKVILLADELNNDSGLIAANATTINDVDVSDISLSSLSSSSVALSNSDGVFVSTASIDLDLGNLDHTITGTVTATNVDITANNIINQGNVTASDFITLNATGVSGSGNGNITNGYVNNDTLNADVLLAAGTYIDFTAKNDIYNYGTISASTDLTLTATEGDVHNFSTGSITGGSGTATVNALNGAFNNYNQSNDSGQVVASSVFTANNDAVFNVYDLNNSGEIAVRNDLIANVSNNVSNYSTALIWVGNGATFNLSSSQVSETSDVASAGIFKNYLASIYTGGNLIIQRSDSSDSSSNKINLFQNISGKIVTLGYDSDGAVVDADGNDIGSITIKSNLFENKRAIDPKTGLVTIPEDYWYHWNGGQFYKIWDNTDADNWTHLGNGGSNSNAGHSNYYATQGEDNLTSRAGSIQSSKNLTIEAGDVLNYVSYISSVGNITIQADVFKNYSFSYYQNFVHENINVYGGGRQYQYKDFDNLEIMSSTIKASSFSGSGFTQIVNSMISPKYNYGDNTIGDETPYNDENADGYDYVVDNYEVSAGIDTNHSTTVNNIDVYTLGQTGEIDVDLTQITDAITGSDGSTSSSTSQDSLVSLLGLSAKGSGAIDSVSSEDAGDNNVNSSLKSEVEDVILDGDVSSLAVEGLSKGDLSTSDQGLLSDGVVGSSKNGEVGASITDGVVSAGVVEGVSKGDLSTLKQGLLGDDVVASSNSVTTGTGTTDLISSTDAADNDVNSSLQAGDEGVITDGVVSAGAIEGVSKDDLSTSSQGLLVEDVDSSNSVTTKEVGDSGITEVLEVEESSNSTTSNQVTQGQKIEGSSNSVVSEDAKSSEDDGEDGSVENDVSIGRIITQEVVGKGSISLPSNVKDEETASEPTASIGEVTATATTPDSIFSGIYKINLNGAQTTPLVESRSQFTDTSKFLGSTYYFDQLGLDGQAILADIDRLSRVANPNADIADSRILGDSFVESELILKELKTLTNDSLLLSEDVVDDEEQVKELLDNAVSEFDALGIDASDVAVNGLTQEQIDSLSKDIVTFETVEVNGLTVLAPKIYLSLATRERLFGDASGDGESEGSLADGSVMFGKESFVIDAVNADFINNGTIRTGSTVDASGTSLGGNLTLNVASLTNRTNSIARARIISGNDLAITANDGDIKNLGAKISATANLNLSTVNGSIINSAIVQTNDANLLNQNVNLVGEANTTLGDTPYQLAQGDYARSGGNITSTLLHNASITGGSITINAANDFTNLAASMVTNQNLLADASTTSGDLSITAGDDITIDTLQLRNRSERRWGNSKKGGVEIKDYTTNLASGISSAGNVSLITTKLGTDSESALDPTLTTTAISNINIVGSRISAANNITLLSADNVNIISAQDSSSYFKAGSSSGKSYLDSSNSITQISSDLITLNNGNISITSGVNNSDVIGADNSTGSIAIIASNLTTSDVDGDTSNNVGSGNIALIAKEDITIKSAADYFYEEKITSKKGTVSKKGSTDIKQTVRNVISSLSSTNDINITSGDDLTITASDLTAINDGNITVGKYFDTSTNIETINEDAILTITAAKDIDYDYHYAFSEKMDAGAIAVGAVVGFVVGGPAGMVAGAYNGSQAKVGGSNLLETYDETLISTNINMGNNLTIRSASDINIESSDLTAVNNVSITAGQLLDKDNNTVITDTSATINVYALQESHKRNESNIKLKVDYVGVAAGAAVTGLVGTLGGLIAGPAGFVAGASMLSDSAQQMGQKTRTYQLETSNINRISSNITSQSSDSDIKLDSQGSITISASNLISNNDINLTSTNGYVNIASALEEQTTKMNAQRQDFDDVSLEFNRGRTSIDLNAEKLEEVDTLTKLTNKASNLTASNNINIISKDDINILASNLSTTDLDKDGSITLTSNEGNVNILSQADTTTTSTETKSGTLTISTGVGNAHVDTAYAEYDLIEAVRNVADAKKNLNHMETLRKNGQADNEAVRDAQINLQIAVLNVALAEVKLAAAASKSAAAFESGYTGFYGDVIMSIGGTKTNSATTSVTNVASNINSSNGNVIISSGMNLLDTNTDLITGTIGNTTVTGSNVTSTNGDISITSKNNISIQASNDTFSASTTSEAWESSLTLASSNAGGAGAAIDNAVNVLKASLSLNMSRSKSDTNSATYNYSQLTAGNGNITINSLGTQNGDGDGGVDVGSDIQSGGDANILGANILASNITLNTQGNLTVESKQNSYLNKGKSFGINLGGGASNVSGGINYSTNKIDRLWTDNQTSIIGTNSVIINTGSNTNVKGAVIANITNANTNTINDGNGLIGYNVNSDTLASAADGGNLSINTKTLSFSNLEDHYYTENRGINLGTTIGASLESSDSKSGNGTSSKSSNTKNPNQNVNFFPSGSTTIGFQNSSSEKEQTTFATIGSGSIITGTDLTLTFDGNGDLTTKTGGALLADNDESISNLNRDITKSQIVTKDMITGALDVNMTIDNRLIAAVSGSETAQKSLKSDQVNFGENIKIATEQQLLLVDESIELVGKTPIIGGVIRNTITSPVEGVIDYFIQNDSVLLAKGADGKAVITDDPTQTRNYAANGINVDLESGSKSYVEPEDNDVTLRLNPTSGFIGNLIKSGLDKTLGDKIPGTSAMARLEAGDIYARRNVGIGAGEFATYNSLFHSENTIIGANAMKLYNKTYHRGFDVKGNAIPGFDEYILSNYAGSDSTKSALSLSDINPHQVFVAGGPARSEVEWKASVKDSLQLNQEENSDFVHDKQDPVLYLTAPSNIFNDISGSKKHLPVYLPNPIDPLLGAGLLLMDGLNAISYGTFYQAIGKEKSNIEYHDVTNPNYSKYLRSFEAEARDNQKNISTQ